jgi:hypothetical protein
LSGRCLELALEGEDRPCEAAAAADQLARDPHLGRLLEACEAAAKLLDPDAAVERTERDRQLRIEIVQMPAQPLLGPPPLVD